MPRLHELSREDVPLENVSAYNAVVSRGAVSLGATVSVKIPALDGEEWDGVRWLPRAVPTLDAAFPVEVRFPARGDGCEVVFDEDGDPQITVWWGAGTLGSLPGAGGGGGGGASPDASTTVKGISKLSVAPAVAANPIAAGTNDPRMTDARTPTAHAHPQSDVTGLAAALTLKQDASTAATDSELAAHEGDTTSVHGIADTSALALTANVQPLDSDLTSIAALTTTSYGRAFLALADAAAARTAIGSPATAHTHAQADVTGLVTDLAAKQPLDSDLTALAALTTTAYGRSLLEVADAAAGRTLLGAAATAHTHAQSDVTNLVSDLVSKANLVASKVPTSELGGAGADATKFLRGDQTWATPAGGGGGGGTGGTATVDFGAFPGTAHATAPVTGQTAIVAGSRVKAWIRPQATADHNADEHLVDPPRLVAGDIVAGTGFSVHGFEAAPDSLFNEGHRLYGLWSFDWEWV